MPCVTAKIKVVKEVGVGNIGVTSILLVLIVALIAIGGLGIRRHQPQLIIIASLGLALIVIGMIWFILTPDPNGAAIVL